MAINDDRRTQDGAEDAEARLRRLPEDDRLICVWWCIGFSESEIATHLEKSLSTVQAAIRRAAEHLR